MMAADAIAQEGFSTYEDPERFDCPVGTAYDGAGREFVWEQGGRVWVIQDGVRAAEPLIDLTEEVGKWFHIGLVGLALDPAFLDNGRIYLFYAVDRHYLLAYGTDDYVPGKKLPYKASIGRITRYTADAATGFSTLVPGSRKVLLGETKESGVPILHDSHGVGALAFGEDGTLLAAVGDSASYAYVDAGNAPDTYHAQAIADGILRPDENVGAFRAQMVTSLCGKILRLDPETGDGVASNPFFNAADPRAPESRVWSLGLRNPFRFFVMPGTGNADPAAGDPGTLFIGDVGWLKWEELDIAEEGGQNFGWPIYEGFEKHDGYAAALTENPETPHPNAGLPGCTVPVLRFQDLLATPKAGGALAFPDPCNPALPLPAGVRTFAHTRPALDIQHGYANVRVPDGFDPLGNPKHRKLPEAAGFFATCIALGTFHDGAGFPPEFGPSVFVGDYRFGWIARLKFNAANEVTGFENFALFPARIASVAHDPVANAIVATDPDAGLVRRISPGEGRAIWRATGAAGADRGGGIRPRRAGRRLSGWRQRDQFGRRVPPGRRRRSGANARQRRRVQCLPVRRQRMARIHRGGRAGDLRFSRAGGQRSGLSGRPLLFDQWRPGRHAARVVDRRCPALGDADAARRAARLERRGDDPRPRRRPEREPQLDRVRAENRRRLGGASAVRRRTRVDPGADRGGGV
ncbi:MAG: PQQ-dependent sugar dehydrogenase [Verrucomicrobiales bacterium]